MSSYNQMGCNCKCNCKPDEISFWWMHDNHTFTRLIGKNLDEIVKHAQKIRKKDDWGMLCAPSLLKNGNDIRRVGESISQGINWNRDLKKWIESISNDSEAMELIATGKIAI